MPTEYTERQQKESVTCMLSILCREWRDRGPEKAGGGCCEDAMSWKLGSADKSRQEPPLQAVRRGNQWGQGPHKRSHQNEKEL